jgi:hypothetical protein
VLYDGLSFISARKLAFGYFAKKHASETRNVSRLLVVPRKAACEHVHFQVVKGSRSLDESTVGADGVVENGAVQWQVTLVDELL